MFRTSSISAADARCTRLRAGSARPARSGRRRICLHRCNSKRVNHPLDRAIGPPQCSTADPRPVRLQRRCSGGSSPLNGAGRQQRAHEQQNAARRARTRTECKDPRTGWEEEKISSRGCSVAQPEERPPTKTTHAGAGNRGEQPPADSTGRSAALSKALLHYSRSSSPSLRDALSEALASAQALRESTKQGGRRGNKHPTRDDCLRPDYCRHLVAIAHVPRQR